MIPVPGRDRTPGPSECGPSRHPKGLSMHRFHSVLAAILLAAVPFSASCCCNPCLKPEDRRQWVLTCVDVDRSALCNAGSLPMYHKSDGYSFGSEPTAIGAMQASRDGLWTIDVKFRETVVGFSGRTGAHEYSVIQLAGKCDSSGQRICAQGAMPSDVMTGLATEVHVTKISDCKLKVQAWTKNKRLPYVYTFDKTPPQPRPVSVPLL